MLMRLCPFALISPVFWGLLQRKQLPVASPEQSNVTSASVPCREDRCPYDLYSGREHRVLTMSQKLKSNSIPRRRFLTHAGLATAAVSTLGVRSIPSLKALGYKSPNERLNLAAI